MRMITEAIPATVQIDLDGDHRLTLTSAILPSLGATIVLGEIEGQQLASQLRGDHASFTLYRDSSNRGPLDRNGWRLFTMSELGQHIYLTICDVEGREISARLTHTEAQQLAAHLTGLKN